MLLTWGMMTIHGLDIFALHYTHGMFSLFGELA